MTDPRTPTSDPVAEPQTEAVMDYPTAWEFVRGTKPEDHAPRCSWRTEHGAFLCDCSVIWREYGRREARQQARAAFAAQVAALREALADARRLAYPFSLSPVQRDRMIGRIDALIAASPEPASPGSGLREALERVAAVERVAAAIDDPEQFTEVHRMYRAGWTDALRAVRDECAARPDGAEASDD